MYINLVTKLTWITKFIFHPAMSPSDLAIKKNIADMHVPRAAASIEKQKNKQQRQEKQHKEQKQNQQGKQQDEPQPFKSPLPACLQKTLAMLQRRAGPACVTSLQ